MAVAQSSESGSQTRQVRIGFALALLVLVAVHFSAPARLLELNWLDLQFRVLRQVAPLPVSQEVVVVGIDDATVREMNLPLATMHAELGRFLEAMALARPRAVGLDVTFPQTSYDGLKPGLDAALLRGMLRLRNVAPLVLGITIDAAGAARPVHQPFLTVAGREGVGYVLVQLDEDGAIRRFDERLGERAAVVPTLAGQLARRLGVPVEYGLVQFALGPDFDYVPLHEVLALQAAGDGATLARRFGGKVVILGNVFPYEDQLKLPVRLAAWDRERETTHGVLIHAQQMRSLLEGRIVPPAGDAAALLLVCAAALAWWLRPGAASALATATVAAGALGLEMVLLRRGLHVPLAWPALAALLAAASRAALEAWFGMREKRWLRAAFAGFVSPVVLREILGGRLQPQLGGERREICLLFSDIRGFTTLSESLPPEEVTRLLDRYFGRMVAAIHAHGGTLDKFMGDGIMAFFGAPQPRDNPCADAFAAARAMLGALAGFNRELAAEGRPPLAIGIGLHYGAAVVGYIGAADRHEYTAIGDAVNAASRIEGLTKEAGYPLLASRAVLDRLPDRDGFAPLGELAVKGRAAVEVFGWRPPPYPAD
ncbi:MAG: adenylate/guanylate cyclase domain-containing protein [Betaproteobacteria bacterium]|nr:MAG: adenylate/guanylate cyclase domain-containing protein [Betaproteobacteria bacterium]